MGELKGFIKYKRQDKAVQPVEKRTGHFREFTLKPSDDTLVKQAARCNDCGVPFCHSACPVYNLIPEWNDLVYKGRWKEAAEKLFSTNNFPEFTGKVCPALCENSCTLAISNESVTIKNIELAIAEKAFEKRWMKARPPKKRTGKKVAVIGSGPSGLACADQLNRAGHTVTVYEKSHRAGGLLALGIPDFKLDKRMIDRRINIMEEEGITFMYNTNVGVDIKAGELKAKYDAIVLCGGAGVPRDLQVPGRQLKGIHFALDYLTQQNIINSGGVIEESKRISAEGKRVIVIGGGDTGADCVGTAIRQGAISVQNFELLDAPPKQRTKDNPWPQWARVERKSTSHEEGCQREFSVLTKSFVSDNGAVKGLNGVKVDFIDNKLTELAGTEFFTEVDLVLLAMGFTGPVKTGLLEQLGVEFDARGNVKTDDNKMTSIPGVFSAGDMRRGQSLVVWAIREGRDAAEGVSKFLY